MFTNLDDGELIMIGSPQPMELQWDRLKTMAKTPKWQRALVEIPFYSAYDFLSNFSMTRENVMRITEGAKINTDINAYAEVKQSQLFYSPESNGTTAQEFLSSHFNGHFSHLVAEKNQTSYLYYDLLKSLSRQNKYDKYYTFLEKFESTAKGQENFYERLGELCFNAERYASSIRYLKQGMETRPTSNTLSWLIAAYLQVGQAEQALKAIRQYPRFSNDEIQCQKFSAHMIQGDLKEGRKFFKRYMQNPTRYNENCPATLERSLGIYFSRVGEDQKALDRLNSYYNYDDQDILTLGELVAVYSRKKDWKNSKLFSDYFYGVLNTESARLTDMASYYRESKFEEDAVFLDKKAESYQLQ